MSQQKESGGGLGFLGLLGLAFIILKLTKQIGWDWLWVLAPLWIPFAVLIAGLIIYFLVKFILSLLKKSK